MAFARSRGRRSGGAGSRLRLCAASTRLSSARPGPLLSSTRTCSFASSSPEQAHVRRSTIRPRLCVGGSAPFRTRRSSRRKRGRCRRSIDATSDCTGCSSSRTARSAIRTPAIGWACSSRWSGTGSTDGGGSSRRLSSRDEAFHSDGGMMGRRGPNVTARTRLKEPSLPDRGRAGFCRGGGRRLRCAGDAGLVRENHEGRGGAHSVRAGPPRSGGRRPGCALGRGGRRPTATPRPFHRGMGAARGPGWGDFSPGACRGPPHRLRST